MRDRLINGLDTSTPWLKPLRSVRTVFPTTCHPNLSARPRCVKRAVVLHSNAMTESRFRDSYLVPASDPAIERMYAVKAQRSLSLRDSVQAGMMACGA
jgi:hypothetical protein